MKMYRILGVEGRITIPWPMRQAVGFQPKDIVSFEMVAHDSILVRREKLMESTEPKNQIPKISELLTYLENLSRQEQYQALVHLSVLWAEHQSKPPEGGPK